MRTAGATKQRHAVCPSPSSAAPWAAACASCAATRGGKLEAPAVQLDPLNSKNYSYHHFRMLGASILSSIDAGNPMINLPPLGDGLKHPFVVIRGMVFDWVYYII